MECDTGAVVSVMGFNEFKEYLSHLKLEIKNIENLNPPLCTVSGKKLKEVGMVEVRVNFCG